LRTDDLMEIQQLPARYAVTITQRDIDGLLEVFTPDGATARSAIRTRWPSSRDTRTRTNRPAHERHQVPRCSAARGN